MLIGEKPSIITLDHSQILEKRMTKQGINKSTMHKWTARERTIVTTLAKEKLSISRAVHALCYLYNVSVTTKQLGAFASRHKIKFCGEYGAPYGNTNRTGQPGRTLEQEREVNKLRMRKTRGISDETC
jgi:hypothetical protein